MKNLWRIACLFIFSIQAFVSIGQVERDKPVINGQVPSPLVTLQGVPVIITLANLIVTPAGPGSIYPIGFTLEVNSGEHYKVSGATVKPDAGFAGMLTVPVRVAEGKNKSEWFDLQVNVIGTRNAAPRITGQTPVTLNQGESTTITLAQLTVTDSDDPYPNGFTLTAYSGKNYTINGTTVTPAQNFSGDLKVPVSVNDGKDESNRFDFKITVQKPKPVAPTITGQQPLTMKENETITIKLTDLTVSDPDSNFPQDFTLKIAQGAHYTVDGATVTPEKNYSGSLPVTVRVNDGTHDSPPFNLQIAVMPVVVPVNVPPVITAQKKLTANQGNTFTINLSDLTVVDPDNKYPDDFTLKINPGSNYVAAGNTVNPSPAFAGMLTVSVSVNDGTANSPNFNVQVEIIATRKNVPPTITGQKAISITQNSSITIQLFHLVVTDPDNDFPTGFSLKVSPGTNYTVTGTTVKPVADFVNGTLQVGVRVNDGQDDSPLFTLKIQVTPISATPTINGQKELIVREDSAITINLSDLLVTDADNPNYPQGFTLSVQPDNQGTYKANGTTITPAPDLTGFIEVGVTVSDGVNTSNVFKLSILITPVNDPPVITLAETSSLPFQPGRDPAEIFKGLTVTDVDNEYLTMAEIGFRETNYSAKNDELQFGYDNPKIKATQDTAGILLLIGNATVAEYQAALRSIKYNYRITEDANGVPEAVLSGPRTIYVNVRDGQSASVTRERAIDIEAEIKIDIPTAFTPNGDNANDTWHVQLLNKEKLDQATIKVYTKRGLLIYEANGFDNEWDATFRGERLPVDSYFYTIIIDLPYGQQTYKGVVTILY